MVMNMNSTIMILDARFRLSMLSVNGMNPVVDIVDMDSTMDET